MPDPLSSLAIAGLIAGVLALFFWPEGGLFWRWRRTRQMTERVLVEDALKHLYESQMEGQCPTRARLAAALQIAEGQASELLAAMAARELVETADDQICLTAAGTDHALHILRAHRLWERYLAEETGFHEREWHERAHRQEHLLSQADLDELAALLNNPTHDPHGDPIPTAHGQMAAPALGQLPGEERRSLTDVKVGAAARIVHLEDEPPAVYAQLVAEGIAPGMTVRVLERTAQRIRFWAEGDEHVLAPVMADNISVAPELPDHEPAAGPTARLTALRMGERAVVAGLAPTCRGAERRRFLDLGILPGTEIEAALFSPSGNPVAYRVRGSLIALRRDQAEQIQIRSQEVPA
jgi:DtxR family Mn-dependent transcriptional regulator